MPFSIKAIATCDPCGEETEDIVLLRDWYPTWGEFAAKIGEIGWMMKVSKNGKEWELFCPRCKYEEKEREKKKNN